MHPEATDQQTLLFLFSQKEGGGSWIRKWADNAGRKRCQGNKWLLQQSSAYPRRLGFSVVSAWRAARSSESRASLKAQHIAKSSELSGASPSSWSASPPSGTGAAALRSSKPPGSPSQPLWLKPEVQKGSSSRRPVRKVHSSKGTGAKPHWSNPSLVHSAKPLAKSAAKPLARWTQ